MEMSVLILNTVMILVNCTVLLVVGAKIYDVVKYR